MLEVISAWIRALAGAAVFCAMALALCPEGRVKRVLRLACGLVMAAALLSPVLSPDSSAWPEAIARYAQAGKASAQSASDAADRLSRAIIEAECEAYILDKAAGLGLDCGEVSVTARWSEEGFWYPWECRLSCAGADCGALYELIESELGITSERVTRQEEG